jgi:hypothetical protein
VVCRGGVSGSVGDAAVEATLVEPVDVGEGGAFDVGESRPWSFRVDQFPFVEPVEALNEGVVIAVALGADRCDDVVLVEAGGVAQRQILLRFKGSSSTRTPVW